MGIAGGVGAHRQVVSSSLTHAACTHQPRTALYADDREGPSGSFSNEHGQQPFRVEVLDPER